MRKFEVGKVYGDSALKFEVVSRTAKTITYKVIQHFGKFNESVRGIKRAKVFDWDTREVFYHHDETIEA